MLTSYKVGPLPAKTMSGADLSPVRPQPDTSLHCQTTNTGLVHRAVCLFMLQLSLVYSSCTYPRRQNEQRDARLIWVVGGFAVCDRSDHPSTNRGRRSRAYRLS